MLEKPTILLNRRKIVASLCLVALLLLIAHVLALIMTYVYGHDSVYGLVPLFNFALEQNAPTYFSTLLLLFNGILFFLVWKSTKIGEGNRTVWLVLSIIFCFLSLDEFATIHELLIIPIRQISGLSGIFYFAWIVPYGIAVLILAFFVTPVIWRLGRRYVVLFFSSAACYVGGAIGIEMVEGLYYESTGSADMTYRIISSFQEVLEIIGLLILVHTLLSLLQSKYGGFAIVVTDGES